VTSLAKGNESLKKEEWKLSERFGLSGVGRSARGTSGLGEEGEGRKAIGRGCSQKRTEKKVRKGGEGRKGALRKDSRGRTDEGKKNPRTFIFNSKAA